MLSLIHISFISPAQALVNFSREVGGKSLAQVREEARKQWNSYLGRIEAEGGSEEQLRLSLIHISVIES